MTTGAGAGLTLVSDATGLASWSPFPSDSDWAVAGTHLELGVPGNVHVGSGLPSLLQNLL